MNIIATIQADLETSPLGVRSRLADEIGGVTVLRRTLDRLRRVGEIEDIYVLCPTAQRDRCSAIVSATDVFVHGYELPPAPWASLVQSARKWSLDGWRGGLGGSTHFDEFIDARLIHGLLGTVSADAVLTVPAAAVLLDAGIIQSLIKQFIDQRDELRMTFAQAPPGLGGVLMERALIADLAQKNIPLGWLFSYKPDEPQKDLIFQPCCVETPVDVRYVVGRLLADTDRSFQHVATLLREHSDPDLPTIGRCLDQREADTVELVPHEVEIELTTHDPYPNALLRPRGARVPRRGPLDVEHIRTIVDAVTQLDDGLVVLGGFGDPLRHPQFAHVLERVRSACAKDRSVYGLAVRTTAVDLDEEAINALIEHRVDVLEVLIDAWTPELYGQLQSPNDSSGADLEAVCANLDRLARARERLGSAVPLVVPTMTKSRDNVHELDDFHDGWLRRIGAVAIQGFSHYGATVEDRSVIRMAPPTRVACRRLRSRCMVLADGSVTLCDQDVRGAHVVGSLDEQSLEGCWRGPLLDRVRIEHRSGRFGATPICAACDEWHRP